MATFKSLLKSLGKVIATFAVIGLLILSIRVTKPDIGKLISSGAKAENILGQLLTPSLFAKESDKVTVSQIVPVPCGAIPNPEELATGPRIILDPPCGSPKDKLTLHGYGLTPNAEISLRWILPEGGLLSIKNIKADANGEINMPLEVRPITATKDGTAAQISFEVSIPTGKWIADPALKDVLDAMFVTIFMALIATTIGTILALPLSFLAASNITRKGKLGSIVYYIVRGFLEHHPFV